MSTDLQQYSTENQLDTIRRYAERRGYAIIRVFEDSGRSGLNMDGRDGLNSLMLEVQSGTADFQVAEHFDPQMAVKQKVGIGVSGISNHHWWFDQSDLANRCCNLAVLVTGLGSLLYRFDGQDTRRATDSCQSASR
jgi:hypothetical protein